MNIELLKLIPVGQTFVLGLIVVTAATENLIAVANYALTKEENAITIDNAHFTKFIGIAAPSTYIILSILW